ncbi:hypothetical protein KDK88_05250 [bacterium]|nr:hypothetical protein [bacterium]
MTQFSNRIATVDGQASPDGKPYIELPDWFRRTGRRSFEIETGFGLMKCESIIVDGDTLTRFANNEQSACKRVLAAIKEIPNWEAEEDVTLERDLVVNAGEIIPQPTKITQHNPKVCAEYVRKFMPPSAIVQLVMGLRYMELPPIAYTGADQG